MTEEKPREFGRRAPPIVLHKPTAPADGSPLPIDPETLRYIAEPLKEPPLVSDQKRSLAVSLATMGAFALGAYAIFGIGEKVHCEPDPNNPEKEICHRSSGWHWSSGSSGGGSHWSGGSSSTHGMSFGGFGHSGGSFGGGS
jgi:hypothetical protein